MAEAEINISRESIPDRRCETWNGEQIMECNAGLPQSWLHLPMPFGRYRGQPIEVLTQDLPYLRWLLNQAWFTTTENPVLVGVLRKLLESSCGSERDQEAAQLFAKAATLQQEGQRRSALKTLEHLLAIRPDHLPAIQAKVQLEWPERGLNTIDSALLEQHKHPRLLMMRAELLERVERFRDAVEVYEGLWTTLTREQPGAAGKVAGPLQRIEQTPPLDLATPTPDVRAEELHLAFCLCLLKWGSHAMNEGRFDETLAAMKRLHHISEGEFTSWRMYSLALLETRQPLQALYWLDKALEVSVHDGRCFKARGRALYALQRYAEAVEDLDRAIEFDDADSDTWFLMGMCLDELERYREAADAYGQALDLDQEDAYFWYSRGNALYNLDSFELALPDFEEAFERDPGLIHALFLKSMCLSHLGRNEEAIVVCTQVLEMHPSNDEAWYNRACYYSRCGDRKRALQDLKRAVSLDHAWCEAALEDADFNVLRKDAEFKKIVGK